MYYIDSNNPLGVSKLWMVSLTFKIFISYYVGPFAGKKIYLYSLGPLHVVWSSWISAIKISNCTKLLLYVWHKAVQVVSIQA